METFLYIIFGIFSFVFIVAFFFTLNLTFCPLRTVDTNEVSYRLTFMQTLSCAASDRFYRRGGILAKNQFVPT